MRTFRTLLDLDNNNGVLYNDDSWRMELIATSDQQLRHLGYHDPDLAPYFAGVPSTNQNAPFSHQPIRTQIQKCPKRAHTTTEIQKENWG